MAERRAHGSDPAVRVAVVDTGIETGHPGIGPVSKGVRLALDGNEIRVSDDWQDHHGHGTACAGVVRRLAPDASLYALRIASEPETSSARLIAEAIRRSVRDGIDIINVSLGTQGQMYLDELRGACEWARQNGATVVAAEANDGGLSYPAAFESVVSVGAIMHTNTIDLFRDPIRPRRFVASPARRRVCWINGKQVLLGGASLAAARVTGLLARIKQRNPSHGPDALVEELGRGMASLVQGAGRVAGAPSGLVSVASLGEAPPPFTRVALFPFSKELHSLVRFRDLAPFSIVQVMDILGSGQIGRDAGEALNLAPAGLPITNRNFASLDHADGLILGHLDLLMKLRGPEIAEALLVDALRRKLHLYSLDPLDQFPALSREAENCGLVWRSPKLDLHPALIAEAVTAQDLPVDVPVLGVFGTRSRQGKFTTQMELRRQLEHEGYRIGHLATEPQAKLLRGDALFPMGYGTPITLDLRYWIPYIRLQLLAICQHQRPDMVIVGSQSGSFPRDPHLRSRFLCLNSLHFLYGARPDAVILCVEQEPDAAEAEYTKQTISAIRFLGKARVIALSFSGLLSARGPSARLRTSRFMDEEESFIAARRLSELYGLPTFCPTVPGQRAALCDEVIRFFAEKSPDACTAADPLSGR